MERREFLKSGLLGGAAAVLGVKASANKGREIPPFEFEEATVADLQSALKEGRETARSITQKYLERLEALGYNKEEISQRLAMLSPEERHDLATRIDSLNSGQGVWGIVIGILVVVLLVFLILHFADKRVVVQ